MKQQWQVMAKWAVLAAFCAMGVAHAGGGKPHERDGGEGPQGGPGEGFRAKAIAACSGKQAGDAVTLTGPEGQSMAAVCTLRPAELVAIPKAHLERMEQARNACKGLTEGASAVLSAPDGRNLAAHCESRDGTLVAVPDERPGRRERN
ncbi:hypothetical protein HPT27_17265 [Permianibacter sp. IMCC34836]|uniref:hypothetical protein n=1 Tax=Permianibacter fluminis TaxID=2738515 RepID=UPI001553FDD6|nr:hypothetical protein [Permianibacter fluminis]NQD38770.1 hypothetical protein [Permianibacter fluminis]